MAKFLDTSRGYLRLDFAHGRPNNNAMHHLHSGMIYEIRSMKSFAAFRIILVIFGAPDCVLWRSVKEFFRTFSRIAVMLMSDKEA